MSCFEPDLEKFKRFTEPNQAGQRVSCQIGDDWYHIEKIEFKRPKYLYLHFRNIESGQELAVRLAVSPCVARPLNYIVRVTFPQISDQSEDKMLAVQFSGLCQLECLVR